MDEPDAPEPKPSRAPWFVATRSLPLAITLLVVWTVIVGFQAHNWLQDDQWWGIALVVLGAFLILMYAVTTIWLIRERAKTKDAATAER